MVATNALLSIALSLVGDFSATIHLPREAIPTTLAELDSYLVGTPRSQFDVFLARNGNGFWIEDGTVYRFASAKSYFSLQDPKLIPKFAGTSVLDSNQVLRLASETVEQLAKGGNPTINVKPKLQVAGIFRGERLPFFKVTWPRTNAVGFLSDTACVEIDGRTGEVVFIHLWDSAFRSSAAATAISNRVYMLDQPRKAQALDPSWSDLPHPTTNQVVEALRSLRVFRALIWGTHMEERSVLDVDWKRSWTYEDKSLSTVAPVCQIWLNDGSCFEALGGTVFAHFTPDSCFMGLWDRKPDSEWSKFKGPVVKRWQGLAEQLEILLRDKVGIPDHLLARWHPGPETQPPEPGTNGIKRVAVEWRNWPSNPGRTVWISETRLGFAAEFDLGSGELKWIRFRDPSLVGALEAIEHTHR